MPIDINAFLAMDFPGNGFKTKTVAPGEIIFLEGQPGDCAYVILKGEVQVSTVSPDGVPITIYNMKAGELFGEIALLTSENLRTATTASATGCELLVIERLAFDAHLLRVDLLTQYMLDQFCNRLASVSHLVRDNNPKV